MNIAIDVRSLMEGRLSGVAAYTTNIIEGLVRVAPQHMYQLFYNSATEVAMPQFEGRVIYHQLKYPNRLLNASQWAASWPRWDSLVPADVFFMPNFRLLPLSPNIPVVTTVHDLSFEHFPHFFNWKRRAWHAMMRPQQLMRNSDHLIAVSQHTASDVERLYHIPKEKISVVHSGVSPAPSLSEEDAATRRTHYKLPPKYVLFLAALEPRKNIPSIIEAFSAIAHGVAHDLVIAGQWGWLTRDIVRAREASAVHERIHFPGVIAEEDKSAVYAGADVFVYPSFYEGFGFPPLEALIQGTPVITSANSSLPEIVGPWATLIDPADVGELALVMRELLDHKPRISIDTRKKIAETYSWDTAARKTIAIIEQAA
jgi:glycosyltransferase involved in cell wall biosynthesis